MCLFDAVSDNLSSQISQWIICHIWSVHYVVKCGECVVIDANHSIFGGIDLYKMGRNLDRSDLTELWQSYEEGSTYQREKL